MNTNNTQQKIPQRRMLVASAATLAAGQWATPLVSNIILPAHAQTSPSSAITITTTGTASNVNLPDNQAASTNITFDIDNANTQMAITKVTLRLNITHSWGGDLDVTLTSPSGTSSPLFNDVCRNSGGYDIRLNDNASTMIPNDVAENEPGCPGADNVLTGTFNTGGGLNAFIGEDPTGLWVLSFSDDAGGDAGVLNSATLTVVATP